MNYTLQTNDRKMIVFDMDNTILLGSFIRTAAKAFDFQPQLASIVLENTNPIVRTKKIAELMRNISIQEIQAVANSIEIVDDFKEIVGKLRKKGYLIGIISDSYTCVTNLIKDKFRLDFSIANELEFREDRATGEVLIPSWFFKKDHSICSHEYCKSNVVSYLLEKFEVSKDNLITVGDGDNDICMVSKAKFGVAFCTVSPALKSGANLILSEKAFSPILHYA
ncbi:phosphoserine phosphatase [Pseudarcicella hirudinis]|uniref:phosphoserine phosphatase n=1 Tax=Pseudarcicella hirudinis TaxID=1079859 RepID=A0A1I5MPE2_9BACT|nr:HAD-IB family phosphatase [Pseudarcicella hirudinis]SFP11373.1 phosphoserine phosphatase [Pseudarcicella hirudinis]